MANNGITINEKVRAPSRAPKDTSLGTRKPRIKKNALKLTAKNAPFNIG
jgi:hypothetical protein